MKHDAIVGQGYVEESETVDSAASLCIECRHVSYAAGLLKCCAPAAGFDGPNDPDNY